jgi:hypothetical protein
MNEFLFKECQGKRLTSRERLEGVRKEGRCNWKKSSELNNQLEVNMVKLIDKISQIRKWMDYFLKNVKEKGEQVVNDLGSPKWR